MTTLASNEGEDQLLYSLHALLADKRVVVLAAELKAAIKNRHMAISPEAIVDICEDFNWRGEIVSKKFEDIEPSELPCIALTKNDGYCVIHQIDAKNKQVRFSRHSPKKESKLVSFKEFADLYAGTIITVKVSENYERRTDEERIFAKRKAWFWGLIWEYRAYYGQVVLAALIINLIAIVIPLFAMNVYDRVVPNNAIETLWVLAIGVMLAIFFDFLLKNLRAYFVDNVNKKLDVTLTTQLLDKALHIRMDAQPGSSAVRANSLKEFDSVRDFLSSAILTTTIDLPFMVIFIAVVGFIAGSLFIVPAVSALLILVSSVLLSFPIYHYVSRTFQGSSQKTAILFEALSFIELIKSSSAYASILDRWRKLGSQVALESQKYKFYSTLATNITGMITTLNNVVLVIWGVYKIKSGDITMGALIGSSILCGRALAPLGQVAGLLTRIQQTRCSFASLNQVMDSPEESTANKFYGAISEANSNIKFEKVSFAYPNAAANSLSNISFEVKAGEKVAILGNIGSGKTTILKLLLGFYEPSDGKILVGDIALDHYHPTILRDGIGYLEQQPKILYGTAHYNIKLKAPYATDEEVLEVAKIAGCADFICRHPDGFNMELAEHGKGLSIGQLQTVALARTLLPKPPILLLDEPTSAMDYASEQKFVNNLFSYYKDKTLIMVTHKHSILQLVDRILVMSNGTLMMDDTRERVMQAIASAGGKKAD